MLCDFCSNPKPVYSLGCTTFTIPELGTKSVDAWLACPLCYELIMSQDWDALAERSVELTKAGRALVGYLGKAGGIEKIKYLHGGYREHATGKIETLAPKETDEI